MKVSVLTVLIFLILSVLPASASHHEPEAEDITFEYGGRAALVYDIGDFNILGELQVYTQGSDFFKSLTLGAYYRLHQNIKLGLFYRFQAGARYDDDWISLGDGDWGWADTSDRWEHLLTADISPRFLMPFLPGRNYVLTLRTRYTYNFFNQQQKILFKPDITWFLIIDRQPVLNASVGYGLYFPLNFGDTLVYEHGPYLNVMYHLSDLIKIELSGEYSTIFWSTSEDSLSAGDLYLIDTHRYRMSLGLVFKL